MRVSLSLSFLIIIMFTSCLNHDDPPENAFEEGQGESFQVQSNQLKYMVDSSAKVSSLIFSDYCRFINKKGVSVLSFPKALPFRIVQAAMSVWDIDVLETAHIAEVRTGFTASANPNFFIQVLSVKNEKVRVPQNTTTGLKDFELKDLWWEIELYDSRVITIKATKALFPDEYFEYRDKMTKSGKDMDVKDKFIEVAKEVEKKLTSLPVDQSLFYIETR